MSAAGQKEDNNMNGARTYGIGEKKRDGESSVETYSRGLLNWVNQWFYNLLDHLGCCSSTMIWGYGDGSFF